MKNRCLMTEEKDEVEDGVSSFVCGGRAHTVRICLLPTLGKRTATHLALRTTSGSREMRRTSSREWLVGRCSWCLRYRGQARMSKLPSNGAAGEEARGNGGSQESERGQRSGEQRRERSSFWQLIVRSIERLFFYSLRRARMGTRCTSERVKKMVNRSFVRSFKLTLTPPPSCTASQPPASSTRQAEPPLSPSQLEQLCRLGGSESSSNEG
jgi:hypothetical protein